MAFYDYCLLFYCWAKNTFVNLLDCLTVVWQLPGQRLPLNDDDVSTQTVDGWRRINTLAHYHIPENATFIIAMRQTPSDVSASNGDSGLVNRTFGGNFLCF
jgi:hypothetical protein